VRRKAVSTSNGRVAQLEKKLRGSAAGGEKDQRGLFFDKRPPSLRCLKKEKDECMTQEGHVGGKGI